MNRVEQHHELMLRIHKHRAVFSNPRIVLEHVTLPASQSEVNQLIISQVFVVVN